MTKKEELIEYVNNNINDLTYLRTRVKYTDVTSELIKQDESNFDFKLLNKDDTVTFIQLACDDNLKITEQNLTKQIFQWETLRRD